MIFREIPEILLFFEKNFANRVSGQPEARFFIDLIVFPRILPGEKLKSFIYLLHF